MNNIPFYILGIASLITLGSHSQASAALPLFLHSAQELETTNIPVVGKKTVCTATINSSDEKKIFESKLNKNEFQFVELTLVDQWAPQTDAKKDWFDRACDSKIQCDILIVSGHFGGNFFGSSGKKLLFTELENHSCRKDCTGILSNPKEVFLFGCNTLASKDADSRTPEQYRQVLRTEVDEQGARVFTDLEVEEFVNNRYGATGEQNRDRMRRVFQNVPYIYGFKTKAPLGANISPFLARYVDQALPYEKHLAGLTGQDAMTFPNELLNVNLKNIDHQGFFQCPGVSGLNPNDPYYKVNANLCQFYTYISNTNEKMKFALQLLTSEDGKLYFQTIIKFLFDTKYSSIDQTPAKADLKNNATVKELFVKSLEGMATPVLRSQWLVVGHHMGWLTESEYKNYGLDLYKKIFAEKVNDETAAMACSMYFKDYSAINKDSIAQFVTTEHLNSKFGLQATYCAGAINNVNVLESLKNEIQKALVKNNTVLSAMIGVLDFQGLTLNATTSSILADITSSCSTQKEIMPSCLAAFNNLQPQNSSIIALANKIIATRIVDIKSSVLLLTKANSRYQGLEKDILASIPLRVDSSYTVYSSYFAKFPPTSEEAKQALLARVKTCNASTQGICAGLLEALQTVSISSEDFIRWSQIMNTMTDLDFSRGMFFLASRQNLTMEMAQELFKQPRLTYGYAKVAEGLTSLMKSSIFQNLALQNQTILENLCNSLQQHNKYSSVNPKIECFDQVSNWSAATSQISVAKEAALKNLEQKNYGSTLSSLNYLLKIKTQLSGSDLSRIQNVKSNLLLNEVKIADLIVSN